MDYYIIHDTVHTLDHGCSLALMCFGGEKLHIKFHGVQINKEDGNFSIQSVSSNFGFGLEAAKFQVALTRPQANLGLGSS